MIFAGTCEKADPSRRMARSDLRRRIDRQRVQLWFRWIQHRANGASYYALEKQLIPEGFGRNANGTLSHRNKMARYHDGKHVPRPALVQRAEANYAGSRALLNHVYWQILDPALDVTNHRAAWIAGLGPTVHQVLFASSTRISDFQTSRAKADRRLLRRLENLATFEALAAIALLIREALEAGNDKFAFACARSFWVVLLLVGTSRPFSDLISDMTVLAGAALLDQVCYQSEKVSIESAQVDLIEEILRYYSRSPAQDHPAINIRKKLQLLRRAGYFPPCFVFRLPTISTAQPGPDPQR